MTLDLYFASLSSPCRAALLTARALSLDINIRHINLFAKEQFRPEYLKINPQHCAPTLVDGDFILWESRAIMGYLVGQYGKDDIMYPNDPVKRAIINRLQYFDLGTLYHRVRETYRVVIFDGVPLDPAKEKTMGEAVGLLDEFIGSKKWAAGDDQTIADHALAATVCTIQHLAVNLDLTKYPNVWRWLKQCEKELAGYEENEAGAKKYGELFRAALAKNSK